MNAEQPLAEAKRNHLWRHTVWQTDPELHPLGPRHCAEVYCCEESNGHAVWYVRKLPHADGAAAGAGGAAGTAGAAGTVGATVRVSNGDYLLAYFGRHQRDEAILRAVQVATGAGSAEVQIAALDALARLAQKI